MYLHILAPAYFLIGRRGMLCRAYWSLIARQSDMLHEKLRSTLLMMSNIDGFFDISIDLWLAADD